MIPTYIVDDVESDRYIVRRRLSKAGAFSPLTEATNGAEFLDLYSGAEAETNQPALVLLDINMPELNGFETLTELKRRWEEARESGKEPLLPIIALFSSSDSERDQENASASGLVEHFFTKPIDDEAIAAILETYRNRILT